MQQAFNQIKERAGLIKAALYSMIFNTHRKRWERVARSGPPSWDYRNAEIGKYVEEGASVLDIGSGAQTLRSHLPKSCSYQPCDLVQSTPDVIVFDFNSGSRLSMNRSFDVVICSGVVEYIKTADAFVRNMLELGAVVLISYNPRIPSVSRFKRLSNNWINHMSEEEVCELWRKCGADFDVLCRFSNGELLFRLTRRQTVSPIIQ